MAEDEPPSADWLLETSDGQVHRFRNLTSLQKWIIERKVTRNDKISRTGHAWRKLGEIVELGPFFDVVDEADRARATHAMGVRDLKAEAELARRTAGRVSPAGGVPVPSAAPRRPTPLGYASRPSEDIAPLERPVRSAEIETSVVRRSSGLPKVLAATAIAGAVAYVGIAQPWKARPLSDAGDGPGATSPLAAAPPPPPASPPPAPPPPTAPPAPSPAAESPPPAAAGAASVAEAAAGAAPAAESSERGGRPAAPAAEKAGSRAAAAREADPSAAGSAGRSYDKLVAEADRLLENGATGRALKLYDQALAQRPNGPEAIAGLGYVNLDRGRADIATGYFKRAISLGSYAPAVFGLAEAYRTMGDEAQALAQYERYLQVASGGSDAPAARRQVKVLQAKLSGGAAAAPARTPGGPPPTPSSVLSEPAKP